MTAEAMASSRSRARASFWVIRSSRLSLRWAARCSAHTASSERSCVTADKAMSPAGPGPLQRGPAGSPRPGRTYPALGVRDAVHAATALRAGLSSIVSADLAFDTIEEVLRIDPAAPGNPWLQPRPAQS